MLKCVPLWILSIFFTFNRNRQSISMGKGEAWEICVFFFSLQNEWIQKWGKKGEKCRGKMLFNTVMTCVVINYNCFTLVTGLIFRWFLILSQMCFISVCLSCVWFDSVIYIFVLGCSECNIFANFFFVDKNSKF